MWNEQLTSRGYPSLPDALHAAEFYSGDINNYQTHRYPEETLSPEETLARAWDEHLLPRGYPPLPDALLVAEYYKGDINRRQLTNDCVRCLAESIQDPDGFAAGINTLFNSYNADLQDAKQVSQALFFMKNGG